MFKTIGTNILGKESKMNKKRIFPILLFLSLIIMITDILPEQEKETFYRFSGYDKWIAPNVETEAIEYKGQEALRLKPGKGERITFIEDFEFENGIIELDIAAILSYTGLVFRVRSEHIYEGIYFRPQNSRHENPSRQGHTLQYIANPRYTWYYLREKFPEKYEAHADLPPDEWFHVKVVVAGTKAEVYVNGSESPCLVVEDLKHGLSKGSIGLWCGNTSGATFANLTVKPLPPEQRQNIPEAKQRVTYSPEQLFLFDTFKKRQSVRKFKPTPVPDEHIMKLLDIARSAPTSGNQQPWKFLVIQDREKLDQLKTECIQRSMERRKQRGMTDPEKLEKERKRLETYYGNYLSAPVYIVVLVDSNSRYPSYNVYDGSLAAGYLMIAARALGYGTVFSQDSIPYELIKKAFQIPDHYERICFTPVGVPETWPEPKNKKPVDEFFIFEKFVAGVNYEVPINRTAIKLDSNILENYPGKFEFEGGVIVTISRVNGTMYAQVTGQARIEIFPEAVDKFFLRVVDAQITFTKNEEGTVTELILHQGGQEMHAKKIE